MHLSRFQADGLLLFVALIWGSAFVAQNWAMASVGPMSFTGVRFLVGALVVLPLAWREHRALRARHLTLGAADWASIAGLGLLLCAGAAMQQIGILSTTVTNAGFLTAVYVPLVPLCGWWLLAERPHAMVWPCALACLLGTWLLSGAGALAFNRGDAWVLASALPWTLHVLLVGRVAERLSAPFAVACGQFVACGLAALAIGLPTEGTTWAGLGQGWAAIAYTGVVSVGIGFTVQVVGQRWTKPADAAIVLSSETLFAAGFGAVLMGDRLSPAGWLGCAVMLASIVVVQLLPRAPHPLADVAMRRP